MIMELDVSSVHLFFIFIARDSPSVYIYNVFFVPIVKRKYIALKYGEKKSLIHFFFFSI